MTNDHSPMTNNHRYQLQPYQTPKSRYACPQCNHASTFSRYIDTQTGQQLGDVVGRCSREDNCGYHYTPKQHFTNHPEAGVVNEYHPVDVAKKYPVLSQSFIPASQVNSSLTGYAQNHLISYLCRLFGEADALAVAEKYHVGTSNHWPGATLFWQIDAAGKARTGKIMLYNPQSGRRVKQPYNHIQWVHKKLYAGYYLNQCLFGQHLLCYEPHKPVALVESEKTAIIAAMHLPQYLWLATGGLHNFNAAKCAVLKGRKVMLYPDANACALWQQKAADLELLLPGTRFKVNTLIEQYATQQQRTAGYDIADYLTVTGTI